MGRISSEIVLSLPGFTDPALAVAASRAGALGMLDLEYAPATKVAAGALARLDAHARAPYGVKLDADAEAYWREILPLLAERCRTALITGTDPQAIERLASILAGRGVSVLVEAREASHAELAARVGAAGIVAKGHEAGGRVGEESTFILLQRLLGAQHTLPVFAHGGIGLHTAAACAAAGAAGVVLDWQLALTREGAAALPEAHRARIRAMDGSETIVNGAGYRLHGRSDSPLFLGQDAAFAERLASRFHTVGGVLAGIRAAIASHLEAARALKPLDADSPLARSHGTRYPILQGPMTRVSDVAPFARAVSDGGALPFLALALMRGPDVRRLLEETRELLRDRPWGVGILGFVPLELRREQLEVIREVRPPFALIAGGRPDQALALEREGIATYLHVPSPGLLRMFLADGARRFVFEGRECGGHVGPRSSFVLWETMVEELLGALPAGEMEKLHVVFAGGIHDARSAAMTAAIAAPLARAGAKIGALLGTAYLFTREAVSTGAIQPAFQAEALACRRTVLLETGPGHATRCVDTEFAREFLAEKERLRAAARPAEEIRDRLEMLNLGRLRIASKGIAHKSGGNGGSTSTRYEKLGEAEQRAQGMYMIGQLAELRHGACTVEALHADVARGGSMRLAGIAPPVRVMDERPAPRPCDIAIVGMSCLLPGANDLRAFWANVLAKVDAVTEVPADRWDWRAYFDEDRSAPDKIYSRWGGFLSDVPFDPLRYGMPPSTLASIEPLQLLTLEVARAALADAGYLRREFDRERTSVIFGAGGGLADLGARYAVRSHLPLVAPDAPADAYARLPEWTEDSFAGILPNVAAGRVANRFNLGGVNFTVDAACASSLAAIHLAVRELESGQSEMVIAGGADTMQNPFAYLCFAKTQALSPRGRCRTFDAEADGIVIAEGLVALVLKRLADAERDGDRVYAVIKGVGGSSDGRDRGLTAPRPEGQMRALDRAYERAGFSPATVGLFEAHGTGTVAGDLAEAQSLTRVLEAHGAPPESCAVGSVKSMIGHTKCTAGVAGLMKIALALHDRILPPTINVEKPNPKAGFGTGPLYVNAETRPWLRPKDHPRRAGVSAFGFGGTNFHAVLEEYEGEFVGCESRTLERWPWEVLAWTGADRAAILGQIAECRRVAGTGEATLAALARAAAEALRARRNGAATVTLAVVAESTADLSAKLERAEALLREAGQRIDDPRGIYFSDEPLAREGRVAFLFPGQGAQRPDMLRDLAVLFPEVREAFERADRALDGKFARPLGALVFPRPRFTPDEERAAMEALTDTRVAQPAVGAAGAAAIALLERLNVRPDLVAGHSYGEYVALHAGGRIDEATLIEISEARGRAIAGAATANGDVPADPGTMAAVDAPADQVEAAIRGIDGVVVANVNAPRQTILSGTREAIDAALGRVKALGLASRPLRVACAFHSPLVAPARDRLAEALGRVRLAPGRCPVYSNTTAAPYPDDPAAALALLADHLVRPVRFQDEIEAMHAAGARVFVEAGPGTALTGLTRQVLEGRPFAAIAIDTGKRHGLLQLLHALAQLLAQGVPVSIERLFDEREAAAATSGAGREKEASGKPGWLVNGSSVRPASEPAASVWAAAPREHAVSTTPQARKPRMAPPLPHTNDSNRPTVTEMEHAMKGNGKDAPVHAAHAQTEAHPPAYAPAGDRAAVLHHHQQLMERFLETQRAVMLAYLGAGAAVERAENVQTRPALTIQPRAAVAVATATNGSAHAAPNVPVAAPAAPAPMPITPAPNGNGAAHAPGLAEVTARLVAIVSERTGYPPEMLELDLDLEADLGIDSIKRVEILGTFQTWDVLAGWKADEDFMEKVRTLKTLRAIAELLAAVLAGPAPEPPAAPGPTPGRRSPAERGPTEVLESNGLAQNGNGHDRSTEGTQALAPEVPRAADAAVPAFAIRAVDAPLEPGEGQVLPFPGCAIAITDDEGGIAETLRAWLADLGARALVIPIDETLEARIERLRASEGPLGAVIHLAPLAAVPPFESLDLAGWRSLAAREVKSLRRLARAAGADLRAGGSALFLAATLDARLNPHRGGVHGVLKSLAWEWPEGRCRAVDLDAAPPAEQARRILGEMAASGPDVVSAWRGGRRVVFRPAPALAPDRDVEIDSGAVVLVTGGARGITARIAHALAVRAKPTLVLVGRSPLPEREEPADLAKANDAAALRTALIARPRAAGERLSPRAVEAEVARVIAAREVRENLRAIAETGARVIYRSADVRDAAALESLIAEIRAAYGRIDGVIHGAGVIEDKLLEEKSEDSFDRVFDTKADSAFLLARLLRPAEVSRATGARADFNAGSGTKRSDDLRFFVLMSSVTAAFGNRGQADYGAANEVLNHLAAYLDADWPGRVVALDWGPWDPSDDGADPAPGAGMVSGEVKRQFAARGVQVIPAAAGCEALLREIGSRSGEPLLVMGNGPWAALADSAPGPDAAGATPLLERESLVPEPGGALACVRVLDPAFDRYLHHHKLDGKPVLPAAAALALMAEAAQKAWPERVVIGARDVRVLRGITLTAGPLPVRLSVKNLSDDTIAAAVEITEPERPDRAYYRATILLGDRLPDAPCVEHAFPAPLGDYPLPIGDAYRRWLFHGPVFQCVREVLGVSGDGILSTIRPSRPAHALAGSPRGAWTIDPVLVDGCLQLALLWVRAIHDQTGLPSTLGNVRRYAFDPDVPLRVSLRVTAGAGEANVRSDILCTTPDGRVAFAIDGFEFTCSAALNRLVGWDEALLPESERTR